MRSENVVVTLKDVKLSISGQWIHQGINLEISRGEIVAIVGRSGSGKSTILREILLLLIPTSGIIEVFGHDIHTLSPVETLVLQRRWGILFQNSALFTSLNVLENIAFPLREHTRLDIETIEILALLKLSAVGLPLTAATKYPSELSGGMIKRTALARALIMNPELLLLDEPTTGLDPQGAETFDELLLNLRKTLGLTILLVTHDLDSLWHITDKVAFLNEGRILECATIAQLTQSSDPAIRAYFQGPRGRVTQQLYGYRDGI